MVRGKDGTLGALYTMSTAPTPPLRVGLLLDGIACPRFVARILEDIAASNFAKVELAVYNAAAERTMPKRRSFVSRVVRLLKNDKLRQRFMYELYVRLDARRCATNSEPLELIDCSRILSKSDSLRINPIVKGFTHRFDPEDVESIRERDLDVILRFGFNILRGDILRAARFGVWSFHHGDNDYYRGGPAHFWELVERNPISGVILQKLTEELDAGLVLCKSLFATERGLSITRNRYGPYWGSTHFVIRMLHHVHMYGWDNAVSRSLAPSPYRGRRPIYRTPTNAEMIRWLAPRVAKRVLHRPFRRAKIPHWRIAIRVGGPPIHDTRGPVDMTGFSWIESPRGHFYADPCLVDRDGKTWLFFEDFSYAKSRGVISCAEVSDNGSLGPARTCLERPYHLSYPMVFEYSGEMFMVPESQANETVDLYKATAFPYEWRFEKTLQRLSAVDTTVHRDSAGWWFFAGISEPPGHCAALFLFYSASLTGNWEYHPANPISSDVRNARGAGRLFQSNGRLLRPSQDCSTRYGSAFSLNAVDVLTATEYQERSVLTVDADWAPDLIGTHTYSQCGVVEAVDGCVFASPSRLGVQR